MQTPDCVIAGGHKCGTTSLKEYLGAHPSVATHPQMEFTAFTEEGYSRQRETVELERLRAAAGDRLALAKHASLYAEPLALDRLRAASPSCKVLLILRDPVARARSAFRMESLMGESQDAFETVIARAIAAERNGGEDWRVRLYLHLGCYGRWLEEILSRFPEDDVMVLWQAELSAEPEAAYESVCRWLGIDAGFRPDLARRHNVGADPRSAALARAMKRLRSGRSPVKRAAQRLLPGRAYLSLTRLVRNSNRAERPEAGGGEEGEAPLRAYFESDGERLERLLGRTPPWRA